jgi:hypothetical protein
MFAVSGLLFVPLSFTGLYFLIFVAPQPQNAMEWGLRILLDELAIAGTVFFTVGFLWGISGSRSLKGILDTAAVRFGWIFIPMIIPALLAAACMVLFR